MNEWEWQLLEDKVAVENLQTGGVVLHRGDRVRLRPRAGGDILDLALSGMSARIECLEQDYEGKNHVCVVLDDDPGRDIGFMRQPGHRFFFGPDEVELIAQDDPQSIQHVEKKILIAGIGNIFLGDDGFGVEVAGRLAKMIFPAGVRVSDFGIRGLDLAYALTEGYESTILIDAYPGNAVPGTLTVLEPDLSDLSTKPNQCLEPHAMNPTAVLRMAAGMGAQLKRVLLVGCVPATLGPEEGQMGLSEEVNPAVGEAVLLVESLVKRILANDWPGNEFART